VTTQKKSDSLREPQGEVREGRGGSQFRGLHTFLPVEVFDELTNFAQSRANVNGGWDYGVAIRELLQTKRFIDLDRSYLLELDTKIQEVRMMLEDHLKPKQVKNKESLGLLGQDDDDGKEVEEEERKDENTR